MLVSTRSTLNRMLVYAIEVDDEARGFEAYTNSTLPIDLEHRRIMESVLVGRGSAKVERLYELRSEATRPR